MTTVAIISDIHANLSAFRAVLTDIHKHKVSRIYCLGDLVGYYTEPVPTIHLALARCEVVIKGNQDQAAALGDIPMHYRKDSQPSIELTTQDLTVNERKILHGLPLMYTLYLDNHRAMMIHGGPEYPLDQYICQHPHFLFGSSPEQALINPDNLRIMMGRLQCAVYELPWQAGEKYGHYGDVTDLLAVLSEADRVHQTGVSTMALSNCKGKTQI